MSNKREEDWLLAQDLLDLSSELGQTVSSLQYALAQIATCTVAGEDTGIKWFHLGKKVWDVESKLIRISRLMGKTDG